MQCPKCLSAMQPVLFDDIEVDRCTACGGVWLDAGEQAALQANKAVSQVVDPEQVRTTPGGTTTPHCPRCGVALVAARDEEQPHVEVDGCPACHGRFLDAGEYRDLAKKTLGDFFRRLTAR